LLGGSTTTKAALIAGGLLLVAALAWISFLLWPTRDGGNLLSLSKARSVQPKSTLGQYRVAAPRAYFFSQPREGNRQAAYLMPSSHIIAAIREENGFVYTEFTSNNNKLVKGWLRQQDLMEMAASATRGGAGYSMRRNDADVDAQLQAARRYLADSDTVRALVIYDSLSRREVPEAMYAYGNMALQNRHTAIDCKKAYELVNQASREGYTPAKTTVGFLLVFGADNNRLQAENYGRCTFRPNITRGAQLLIEATLEGDTAAKKWLKQLNQQQPAAPVQ
jgi:serine/threonine-protein kinase